MSCAYINKYYSEEIALSPVTSELINIQLNRIEAFILRSIDINSLMSLSPKGIVLKPSQGYFPASTHQGMVTVEVGMPV